MGGTIGLALDRHRASGPKIASLLVNPGGPGASGVDFLPDLVASMPKSVLQHFDVVGFDPPGVGRTEPIQCLDPAGLATYYGFDPAPGPDTGRAVRLRGRGTGCSRRAAEGQAAPELPYVSTVDAAMDMDVIRQDLGDAKLTYLGFSYGTFLGATYAGHLYPTAGAGHGAGRGHRPRALPGSHPGDR